MAKYSAATIERLLDACDNAETADEKGACLEELGTYLFGRIPGVSLAERNVLDGPRAHELDLAFWNPQNRSALGFLDAVLIVECKASGRPVGSQQVGWLIRKLQDRGSLHGVMIALNGITGNADGVSNAHNEVLSALLRDRIKILVVTGSELASLQSTDDLVALLKGKLLQLVLYRTVG